jgi:hypothetical protein
MNRYSARRRMRCVLVALLPVASSVIALGGQQSPDLAGVLRRAGDTVSRYASMSAVIIADESCTQRAYQLPGGVRYQAAPQMVALRRWKAELALVQLPAPDGPGVPWMELRDVVAVDGKQVPDHKTRLEQMFQGDPNWRTTKAREVIRESAKFNIGPIRRTINTPAVPLLVLYGPNQFRFTFRKTGEDTIDGVRAWKVRFTESRSPTLIRSANDGSDMVANGSLWIAAASGDVVRSELHCGGFSDDTLTVRYQRHPAFGLWLPAEMTEKAVGVENESWVDGECTYSNFRRFETGARIVDPK